MNTYRAESGHLELHWQTDPRDRTLYQLFAVEHQGQMVLLATFEQGPFDTSLEVAQWLLRAVAREVPPATP